MQPNAFLATTASTLAIGGSETELFLSNITTLTGETVTTAQFATMGRGVITVDPLSTTSIEFMAFTGVDQVGVGFTGLQRGLSSLSNSVVAANIKYHPIGTQVIIAFGVHNLLDLQKYITNAVSGSLGTATNLTAGSTKLTVNMGANARARSSLVTQIATPNMTVYVQPFSFVNGSTTISFAGGATGTMTAPVSNPRYDLIVYRTNALAIVIGTEGSSPSLPTATNGDVVLASIYHFVGETTIIDQNVAPNTQGYIASWYEPSVYISSSSLVNSQVNYGTDQSQTTSNGTQAVGKANTTGNPSYIAQSFSPSATSIQGVKLWKIADTGTFTGTFTVSLQADSTTTPGQPSGTVLATTDAVVNSEWVLIPAAAEFALAFTTEYESLSVGKKYWIVVSPSTADSSNHPNLGMNTAGGYIPGQLKYNNSADGWVLVTTSILYFKTVIGVISKIVGSDTDGNLPSLFRPYAFVGADATAVTYTTKNSSSILKSYYLPQGFWNNRTGVKIKVYYEVTVTSNGASISAAISINYQGQTIVTFATAATSSSTTVTEFGIAEIYIVNNAAMNAQNIFYTKMIGTSATTMVNASLTSTTSTIDTTQPGSLEIVATNGNYSSGETESVTYTYSVIEKITSI